ncbi:sigma-54-dependent Fis family transcriptional regulator [Halioglobus sp. HI00S01]|uniref:sigma 54-interacting transcriptional regulator n=1 Tax=Halioglobus sp. HI00S01 TaxID=1822214 RepID=UPI0007C3B763|nr:sigma 54-interacting transcriptional regulator [Halioglobus sp. HI00S01]KZX56518.1 sigma-54-dependent Fis family transcriptional regulator [Halioglobus sp. HI00S01]
MNDSVSSQVKILIVGYRKFSELITAVIPEFAEQADITIVESLAHGNTEYHSLVARLEPDVVASAGSNAAYLANTLTQPVISQAVTDTDIIEALAKARRIASRIHLFSYQPERSLPSRLVENLPGLIDAELIHHNYSTSDEANEKLQLVMAEEAPEVIVGPSFTCHEAEKQGVATILVYSKDSARDMLRKCIEIARQQQGQLLPTGLSSSAEFVIRSDTMTAIARLAQTYAQSNGAVLIQGESGTGKEHIAKEIHHRGPFSEGQMVAVNCGSIPDELFESELFGHVEGAFTSARRGGRIGLIEQANGGTLYLDEVGEMPFSQQVKLLRVLQEKRVRPLGSNREVPVDFKLIAATNRDLMAAVNDGQFREDLFYRLNVFSLHIPPLRERIEDIAAIAGYYLADYGRKYGVEQSAKTVLPRVKKRFSAYGWPGNVRELQNFVERIVVNLAARPDRELSDEFIAGILPELQRNNAIRPTNSLREQEEASIRQAMQTFNGDKARVAESLGISTTTLWRRLRRMQQNNDDPINQISSGN